MYQGGEYVGANHEGQLYKGIVVFMINGLNNTVPTVVRASPEVSINGEWLSDQLMQCINDLIQSGFSIRAIVTDNHSTNVSAFKILLNSHCVDKNIYFMHQDHQTKPIFSLIL